MGLQVAAENKALFIWPFTWPFTWLFAWPAAWMTNPAIGKQLFNSIQSNPIFAHKVEFGQSPGHFAGF